MASDYPDYGRLHSKSIALSEDGVKLVANADASKSVTLKCTPTAVGNVDISLPTSAGSLLSAGSDLSAAKLTGVEALGQPGVAAADVFLYADADDSNNPKGISADDLKTYCSAGSNVPDGTAGKQILVWNNSSLAWVPQDVGGDAIMSVSGNLTFASNSVEENNIADGAVTNDKLAGSIAYAKLDLSNAVTDGDLAGSISYNKLSLSNSIENTDIFGGITQDKLMLDISDTDISGSADIAATKLAPFSGVTAGAAVASKAVLLDASKDVSGLNDVGMATATVSTSVESPIMYFGTNQWRMQIVGGDLVMQKYDTGVWSTHHTFDSGA